MNYGLILAGGVGQRMRRTGMPKQFLEVFAKPIIIYTLQKFEYCEDIDEVVIACHSSYKDYMESLLQRYGIKKVKAVISGGRDRQDSVLNGLKYIQSSGASDEDVVVIHDGVRPLIQESILSENVRVAKKYGNAMTVRPVIESVVITSNDEAGFEDFKKRDDTYSLTAPQSFQLGMLTKAYKDIEDKDVQDKKEAAEKYCQTVSQYTTANGGKPWKYAIVAENDFERTHQLQYVLSKHKVDC